MEIGRSVYERIVENRILPAAVVPSSVHAIPLAKAILAGGLDVMEVTFRNEEAVRCVELINQNVPDILCGAGTLMSEEDLDEAISAGASFGLSPGFNPDVVRAAVDRGFPFIPGVQTPGEMEQALSLGCTHVKFFPAEAAGGTKVLKALVAPFKHTALRIIPLGGIGPKNLCEYLAVDLVVAVGGSWLANAELLEANAYQQLTSLCREAKTLAATASVNCHVLAT